jgi:N-acetylneuraminic acid mutarotase
MKTKILLLIVAAALALFSCTKRKPQEIDLAPNSPFNPYPPDSATNIEHTTLDVTLRWTATDPNSGQTLTYDIYLDTINPPLDSKIASGLTSPNYFLTGLSYNTTYYWKLYITDDKGAITSGPVWQFTTLPHANTAPNVPSYLYPVNNATWQYPTLDLGWNGTDPEGGSDTLYYSVYLGVTPQLSPIPYENDSANIREFTGLEYSTSYYWKVVVHDNHYAYTTGPVQSFSTRDCPWFYKGGMPSPRYGFGTAVVNNKIYVVGGYDGGNYLSEVLEYDPAFDAWTRRADMPTPRSELGVTAWNGKIYAIGGQTYGATCSNNEVYDPLTDAWNILAPLHQENHTITAQAVNGKIYTFGGEYKTGYINGGVFEYDIASNDWWDTTFYYIHYDTLVLDSIVWIDTVNIYEKSTMPQYRYAFCSALYNNDIYLFSGHTFSSSASSNVDIYHPASNSWSPAGPMMGPANFAAAVPANGYIYVLGGYGDDYLRRVRKYDPVTDTWFIRGDMQDYRSYFGTAFINNRIYAFGGVTVLPLSSLEEYLIELDPKPSRR